MSDTVTPIIEDEPLHATLLDRALRQAYFNTALDADGREGRVRAISYEELDHRVRGFR
ncbi:MAG: hypothetical protein R3B37_11215 [Nitrospira sp.]|nr:hypothetical protein [Nitrospira sp.]